MVLIFFIRSRWGQDIIVDNVVEYLSTKTNTHINIDKLYLTFSGNLLLEGMYIEDQKNDTLLYSKYLEASIKMLPLIRGNALHIKSIQWEGVVAKISRKQDHNEFNYQFLIDSLATSTDTISSDNNNETFKISLGAADLQQLNLKYDDEFLGNSIIASLGTIRTKIRDFDLITMHFEVDEFMLQNTLVEFQQKKATITTTEDSSALLLPNIVIDILEFNEVAFNLNNIPDQLSVTTKVGKGEIKDTRVNLQEQEIISNLFKLNNSNFYLKDLQATTTTKAPKNTQDTTNVTFLWPNWTISVDQIVVSDQTFTYLTKEQLLNDTIFDPLGFKLSNLETHISDLSYRPKKANTTIHKLSFTESSGFRLRQMAGRVIINNSSATIADLIIKTNRNQIRGSSSISYNSLQNLVNNPGNTAININLPQINSSIEDLKYFNPSLLENNYIKILSKKEINGEVFANGTIDSVQIEESFLSWGDSTKVMLKGNIENITNVDSLYFDIPSFKITTYREDLTQFIDTDSLGIKLPDSISVAGSVYGSLQPLTTSLKLNSTLGNIDLKGTLNNTNIPEFSGNISVSQVALGTLFNNPQLGNLQFSSDVQLSGNSLPTLNASIRTTFKNLEYNNYDFSALQFNGEITNGKGLVKAKFKDDNLNMHLISKINLDSISSTVKIQADIIGADLYALGITEKLIKTQFSLDATFWGNLENFKINSEINKATVVYQNEPFGVQNMKVDLDNTAKKTAFAIQSGFLNGQLSSNSSFQNTFSALERHLLDYINPANSSTNDSTPVETSVQLRFKETPVLSEVFIPGLKSADTITIRGNFNEQSNTLSASIKTNQISLGESSFNQLNISAKGNQELLEFNIGWDSIVALPLLVNRTKINGRLANQKLKLNFDAFNFEKENTAHIVTELEFKKDTLSFHIDPSSLVLDKTPWQINSNNRAIISGDYISVDDFVLKNNQQSLAITTKRPNVDKKHLNFDFKNFRLSNITNILNENQLLASGRINGEICIERPTSNPGILADLTVDELSILEAPLGKLTLNAESESFNSYNIDLALNGAPVDLDFTGRYVANENNPKVNLDFNLEKLEMSIIERFVGSYVSNATGTLSGTAEIRGELPSPQYSGNFNFNNTGFEVTTLNTRFILPKENIRIDNRGIYLDQFTVKDSNNDSFSLDGVIKTETITNPSFDLTLVAKDFTVLNSTQKDSDLFFGRVNFNTDLRIKGDLQVPVIRGSISLDENSNFTLIVPESELEIKEREGVVLFVNRKNPNAILTRVDESKSEIPFLQGYDVQTRLQVGKKSTFKIVIDESTNDFIQVHGEGDFIFGMSPNGRTNLTGRYDISDGLYRVSLYDLVAREFNIKPGGTIIWKGDPLEAELDVTAIYTVETSPLPLVNSRSTLQARDVDFLVYLNVDGELLTPEISFELDMPEEDKGVLGGVVYGQVQQLNNQESELNKQVFSLLVLNRFFPESGNDGSSGGVAKLARDNVNSVLAGQLNNISSKIIGKSDVDLNFGLNSYSTYQGDNSSSATDLEINAQKSFLDDRLIVQVGSAVNVEGSSQATEESSPIIGNLSLEYLITESGRYRLKGFRKNQFESVIDGQLIVTGIAFIFNREFNKFKDLWRSSVQKELEKRKQEENR